MREKAWFTACLLIVCSANALAEKVVVIGYAGALSGAQAHFGKDSERGIQLAIDEINAARPVIAGAPTRFVLDAEDDTADPRIATTVAQGFVDRRVNAVIGHQSSGTSIAVARLYAAADIAELTPSATNTDFTRMGYRTTFRMLANDRFLGQAMSRYAANELHVRQVAVIDDRTAYGQGLADVFVDDFTQAGRTVVAREYVSDKAFDFGAPLTLFKGTTAEAIFFGGVDVQGGPMLKQMKKLNIGIPLMGGDALCSQEMGKLAGAALEGNLYCADGGRSLAKMPGGPAFAQRFEQRYGEPVQLYAPYAYDAMMAIYHAVSQQQSADSDKIVEGLHHVAFEGVTGHIAFDDKGELVTPAATISTFKRGSKVTLAEIVK